MELNDNKTAMNQLPDGIFRPWKSLYHAINPYPKKPYKFARLKETYLAVVEIDGKCPNTGVIDRFLVDIVKKKNDKPNFEVKQKTLPQVISLLLMLGRLRTKAVPKVLAILEMILNEYPEDKFRKVVGKHLENLLDELCGNAADNGYLILWIVYFLKTNRLANPTIAGRKITNEFVQSVFTSRSHVFKNAGAFNLFTPVIKAAQKISLLDHLAVFKP